MPDASESLARSARELWPSVVRPTAGILIAILLIIVGLAMFPDDPSPGLVGNNRVTFPVVIRPLPQESPPTTVSVSGSATPPK